MKVLRFASTRGEAQGTGRRTAFQGPLKECCRNHFIEPFWFFSSWGFFGVTIVLLLESEAGRSSSAGQDRARAIRRTRAISDLHQEQAG